MKERVLIIDCLRVFAILSMIAYHFTYDLSAYYAFQIDVFNGPWKVLEQSCAGLFLLLSGWSFVLSWGHTPDWHKYMKRGMRILGYGFIVSATTFLFDPPTYVRFGILHLIGVSIMLLPLFVKLQGWVVVPAILITGIGTRLPYGSISTSLLLPIGLTEAEFRSVDYFPLLPWFGIVLLGMCIGWSLQCSNRPCNNAPKELREVITLVSRHSLFIYMIHQPILLILLRIALGRPPE